MKRYVVLMRGINVGGKNKIPMRELKSYLEQHGFEDVITYINSGNVIVRSKLDAKTIGTQIEELLVKNFRLDSSIIRVVALDHEAFKRVVSDAPKEFGEDNTLYRYYILFLMGISSDEAMREISVHEGIDMAWQGKDVIYYRLPGVGQRDATRSHLNKITQKPHIYHAVTMRNWNTTQRILALLEG